MVNNNKLKMEMSLLVRNHKTGTGIRVNELSKDIHKITMATLVIKE